MARYITQNIVDHTSVTTFRVWGALFSASLSACGLVQTSDTGQLSWDTVAKPSNNTTPTAYEIWRNANSTLFFKFLYGTASNITNPRIDIQVGTGSNGSGVLTGQLSTVSPFTYKTAGSGPSNTYTSYFSSGDDFLTIVWGINNINANTATGALQVHKTVNVNGNANTDGIAVLRWDYTGNTKYIMQSLRQMATSKTYNDTSHFALVPGVPTSSELSVGAKQAWHTWMNIPDMYPNVGALLYINSEIAPYNIIRASPVGSPNIDYLTLSTPNGAAVSSSAPSTYGIALRF